jgi:hypothetical protein
MSDDTVAGGYLGEADPPELAVAALLAAAGLALQDAGPDADDPSRRVWIVNNLGGPMLAAGSTAEEAAATALARLRSEAEALAHAAGRTLWQIVPTKRLVHRRGRHR